MFQTSQFTNPADIEIIVDGFEFRVPSGISVAAALLLHNLVPFRRSTVDLSPRAPYCLMGVCSECLLDINGKRGQLSCQTTVEPGMIIHRRLEQ